METLCTHYRVFVVYTLINRFSQYKLLSAAGHRLVDPVPCILMYGMSFLWKSISYGIIIQFLIKVLTEWKRIMYDFQYNETEIVILRFTVQFCNGGLFILGKYLQFYVRASRCQSLA